MITIPATYQFYCGAKFRSANSNSGALFRCSTRETLVSFRKYRIAHWSARPLLSTRLYLLPPDHAVNIANGARGDVPFCCSQPCASMTIIVKIHTEILKIQIWVVVHFSSACSFKKRFCDINVSRIRRNTKNVKFSRISSDGLVILYEIYRTQRNNFYFNNNLC